MGTFFTDCVVANHVHRGRTAEVRRVLVDTGSECTWIAESALRGIGVSPEKKDVSFVLANGQTVSREVGVDSRRKRLVAAGPLPAALVA